jgi:hypothetical protein
MDNSETIPGYKYYVDEDGSRPAVFVAFLDLEPDPEGHVDGVCTAVDPAALRRLDERERNYVRTEVTDAVDSPLGRTWAYMGSEAGRRRLTHGKRSRSAVVSREYLDRVPATDVDGLPVRDLVRVDVE